MQSFWMPKKQPLYAPMLSTFGGGSARGFGAGLSSGGGGFSTQSAFDGTYSSQIMFNVSAYRGMMLVYEDTLDTGDDHIIISDQQGGSFNNNTRYYRNTATSTLTLQNSVNIGSLAVGGGARDSAYYKDSSGNYNIYVAGYTNPGGFTHFRVDSLTKLKENWSGSTILSSYTVSTGTPWGCAVDQDRSYLYIGSYGSDGGIWRYPLDTSDGTPQTSSAQKFSMNSTTGVPVNQAVSYDPWADVLYTGSDYGQNPVIVVRDASDPSSRVGEIQITNNNDWTTSVGCIEASETKLYFQASENSHSPSTNPVYAITR